MTCIENNGQNYQQQHDWWIMWYFQAMGLEIEINFFILTLKRSTVTALLTAVKQGQAWIRLSIYMNTYCATIWFYNMYAHKWYGITFQRNDVREVMNDSTVWKFEFGSVFIFPKPETAVSVFQKINNFFNRCLKNLFIESHFQ